MKIKKITLLMLVSSFALLGAEEKKVKESPKVQIAILLDTSNSMDGLIEQAKTQLWKIVNSFSGVHQNKEEPEIEVALYEYGNDDLSITENYIRKVQCLTTDLDKISESLFSLKTNGGSEFCGAVIQQSLSNLKWDDSEKVYKAIFIAGNEPFTQGSISSTKSCHAAIRKGIVVNTIHCGSELEGINEGWKAGAIAANGEFLTIDQDKAVAHVVAPQDEIIVRLSSELNKTYIPYGKLGLKNKDRQELNDIQAETKKLWGASVQRAVSKVSKRYQNHNWDLVDLADMDMAKLTKLKKEQLPKEYQDLSETELKQKIASISRKRKEIKKQVQILNRERENYVHQEWLKSKSERSSDTLDGAVIQAIYNQVKKNGFELK